MLSGEHTEEKVREVLAGLLFARSHMGVMESWIGLLESIVQTTPSSQLLIVCPHGECGQVVSVHDFYIHPRLLKVACDHCAADVFGSRDHIPVSTSLGTIILEGGALQDMYDLVRNNIDE